MVDSTDVRGSVCGFKLEDPTYSPKTFAPGRTCFEPDCGTILSIYNESNYCALHPPEPVARGDWVRAKRQRRVA